ncbi:MAG: hypothetical protein KDA45_12225, partial [Planctomycetales bacterium]|nr:hypothetical protein [Planctomycetales bacterium]
MGQQVASAPSTPGGWRLPLACCGVALVLLLPLHCWSVASNPWFSAPPKPAGDGPDYENLAFHLASGAGFTLDNTNPQWRAPYVDFQLASGQSEAYAAHLTQPRQLVATGRPPLFPLLVAGVYRVLGRGELGFAAVRLLLASCLALSGALAVFLAAALLSTWPSRGPQLVAAAATLFFAATNRTLRTYATDFLTEPLALLLMQLFVLVVLYLCGVWGRLHQQASPAQPNWHQPSADATNAAAIARYGVSWVAIVAGLLWGALVLARSMFVLWLPAIWLLVALTLPASKWLRFRTATVVVGTACLVCLPWWWRNVAVLERWMPLGTQGPITLLGGYSDAGLQSNGEWQFAPEQHLRRELTHVPEFQALASDTQREVWVARAARVRVRTWLGEHWRDLPWMAAKRI